MTDSPYPTLGFDPAPGDLGSIDDLATKLTRASAGLERAHTTLTRVGHGEKTWEGPAANAFAEKVGDLPKYVGDSRDALRSASAQLKIWHTKLSEYQQKARQYESEAKTAKQKEQAAESAQERATSAYNQAAANPAFRQSGQYFTDQAQLNAAQAEIDAANKQLNAAGSDLDSAQARLEAARGELDAIIKKAEELLDTHRAEARTVADKLEKATEKAPDTGFWEGLADQFTKLGHAIQNWCAENKDLLKEVGDWLSIGSAVMGVLSLCTLWCPPLAGAFALAGGALSLGALATHGAAKIGGADVSAADLIGDGLGVIPFGKFAGTAVKGSTKIAVGMSKVGDAVVSNVDDVQKITRLNRLTSSGAAAGENFGRHAAEGGGRAFEAASGFGNRAKLAWESHVADTLGSSFKEKRISDLATQSWSPLRDVDSFKAAIRADGSLDPTSWWSKGPQIAATVPGIGADVYDKVTGK